MDNQFFERPILNSPYECPTEHWELDADGQPTQQLIKTRRSAQFISPIPKPRKRKDKAAQQELGLEGAPDSLEPQKYDPTPVINELRYHVDQWRRLPNPNDWSPLMDAIECGIVKLPRVPVADNLAAGEMPMFRNLWEHIRTRMPKKRRGKQLDPLDLPLQLTNALDALYGHYAKTFDVWAAAKISVPPCFIVVCNNTSTSKLIYDYISGFLRQNDDGSETPVPGHLALFRNSDEHGTPIARPPTLLIDSAQIESGEGLDDDFRKMAAPEIDRFRREILERTGDRSKADNISDQDLLREVMNTVGKEGRLGESVRCVVSVSMLTEGWDANTVTHVLGVRAFGTQLLCEQVIGRALRRQSYEQESPSRPPGP